MQAIVIASPGHWQLAPEPWNAVYGKAYPTFRLGTILELDHDLVIVSAICSTVAKPTTTSHHERWADRIVPYTSLGNCIPDTQYGRLM